MILTEDCRTKAYGQEIEKKARPGEIRKSQENRRHGEAGRDAVARNNRHGSEDGHRSNRFFLCIEEDTASSSMQKRKIQREKHREQNHSNLLVCEWNGPPTCNWAFPSPKAQQIRAMSAR